MSGRTWQGRGLAAELFTDLYELRMMRAYWERGMTGRAVFSLFVRRLPPTRNLLLACGIDQTVEELAGLRFGRESLDHLATLDGFPEPFLRWLEDLRFTGDVRAVAEGTPVFANEPILEIEAPVAEAQWVETLVMNRVGLQTMLASKALRVATAAAGRPVSDFGGRRAHGADSVIDGARAFHIAGIASTSSVLAGQIHGLPVSGTVAHSFVEACESETDAFRTYAALFPETVLLVDTYDTVEGVRRVVALAEELGADFRISAIRIDSGDLAALSREARAILDAAGLEAVKIFVSGGLDERKVAALVAEGAPVDGFGLGTDMSVSGDAPSLDLVYKLTEYAGEGRLKLSPGKRTLPGPKQVFRRVEGGVAAGDTIARAGEMLEGTPLLAPAMEAGRPLAPPRPLAEIREATAAAVAHLPPALLSLDPADPPYPVTVSPALEAEEARVRQAIAARGRG